MPEFLVQLRFLLIRVIKSLKIVFQYILQVLFGRVSKFLKILNHTGKIITISTFFTEENKYEQRPYRFRTPYTAAQGAKNRLSECFAWELVEKGIKDCCNKSWPVHSDRIYKTVYPKAAAEFLRVGGFPGLSHKQIEEISVALLPYLGDEPERIDNESKKIAISLS